MLGRELDAMWASPSWPRGRTRDSRRTGRDGPFEATRLAPEPRLGCRTGVVTCPAGLLEVGQRATRRQFRRMKSTDGEGHVSIAEGLNRSGDVTTNGYGEVATNRHGDLRSKR